MKAYEYLVRGGGGSQGNTPAPAEVNDLGLDGWELVAVGNNMVFYFKRELSAEEATSRRKSKQDAIDAENSRLAAVEQAKVDAEQAVIKAKRKAEDDERERVLALKRVADKEAQDKLDAELKAEQDALQETLRAAAPKPTEIKNAKKRKAKNRKTSR